MYEPAMCLLLPEISAALALVFALTQALECVARRRGPRFGGRRL